MLNKLVLIAAISFTAFITIINFVHLKSVPRIGFEFDDKIYHVGVYMVFSFLWGVWTTMKYGKSYLKWALMVCLLYGILLEVLQQIINPSRTFDLFDLLSNCIGVLFGIIIVAFWSNKKVKLN